MKLHVLGIALGKTVLMCFSSAAAAARQRAPAFFFAVASEVVVDAKSYGTDFLRWLSEDSTDRYFVNYLRRFAEYRGEPRLPGTVVMDGPARRVIQFLRDRLNTDSGSIFEKARWFRAYWNQTVAKGGVFDRIEAGIVEPYRSSARRIMVRRIVAPGG